MKRILSFILAIALLAGLSACGKKADPLVEKELDLKEGGVALGEDNYTPSFTLNDMKEQEKKEEEALAQAAKDKIGSADPEVVEKREETPPEQLSATDQLRPDTNYGACRQLKGKVGVVLFFLNDQESKWTTEEAKTFTKNELQPVLNFIQGEANKRKLKLEIGIKKAYTDIKYDGTVITSVEATGKASVSIMKQMARDLNYSSDTAMLQGFKNEYQCDEILCFAVFNKGGSSYVLQNRRGKESNYEEHGILFSKEYSTDTAPQAGLLAAPIAHEILQLYGAQVLYSSVPRTSLAKLHFNGDIMLSTHVNVMTNTITDATAFYIGWLDTPPEAIKHADWNAQ